MRILVVEDDRQIGRQIAETLSATGFVAEIARDGEEGCHLGETESYDAIVLDLGLPILDGLSVLQRWRSGKVSTPVLILTARDTWHEKVKGLRSGADDYLTKPFQMEELVARIEALVRRGKGIAGTVLTCGDVRLDAAVGAVTLAGSPVTLTAMEHRLLAYLMHRRGAVVSKTELTEHIYDQSFDKDSNVIEVLINRLRKKLGADLITTRRGLGYTIGTDRAEG